MSASGDSAADTANEGHVRFATSEVVAHESEITMKYSDCRVDVHLGFLQINRYYEVTFTVQDDLGEDIDHDQLQNLHVKVKSYTPTEDGEGHNIVIKFHAHREKLLQELLTLRGIDDKKDKYLNVVLHARVLGKGKGTPALRNGIKCDGIDDEADSEGYSDWQGF